MSNNTTPQYSLQPLSLESLGTFIDLCEKSKNDPSVMARFGSTIDAYTNPNVDKIDRIKKRYEGDKPIMIGAIVLVNNLSAGMISVACDSPQIISNDGSSNVLHGINFGTWLLADFRSKGLGPKLVQDQIDMAENGANRYSHWKNRRLWTGIAADNYHSNHVLRKFTIFEEIGILKRDQSVAVFAIK